jgi:hypothetical protein
LRERDSGLAYTYDNWFVDKASNVSRAETVGRGKRGAKDYITAHAARNGVGFWYAVVFEPPEEAGPQHP